MTKPPRKRLATLNPDLMLWWNSIARDEKFSAILFHLRDELDKYSPERPESIHPHIQSERNGGYKGWMKLEELLLKGFNEDSVITEDNNNHTKNTKKKEREFSQNHIE